ncbi:MAG TPA: NFACT RNA binding domain-containing protein, partial [Bacillota bacterium]|nr:NFACT RNA binding domain-containing protein [Bacillota bacterium]
LVLSAHAQRARVHLTEVQKENPQSPPMFCMILRKYLEGGKITRIEQTGLERVLRIWVEAVDELGTPAPKVLVAEVMGKHSNIILLDPETNIILDGIKRYSHALSRYREVLPGRVYLPPPPQEKLHPAAIDAETFASLILAAPEQAAVAKILLRHLDGFSPESCREVLLHSGLAEDLRVEFCGEFELQKLWQTIHSIGMMAEEGGFNPSLIRDDTGQVRAYSALDLQGYFPLVKEHGSMNTILEKYFSEYQAAEGLQQQKHHLKQVVDTELARLHKKLTIYEDTLAEAREGDTYKLYGDLLTANMYLIKKGMEEIKVQNFYQDDGAEVVISLDMHATPSQNVQYYYKKYAKTHKGGQKALGQQAEALAEIRYLESVNAAIDQAAHKADLAEIKLELVEEGYIKNKAPAKAARKQELKSEPLKYLLSHGYAAMVGKNNRQNDHLTLRLARANDLWLHVKDLPGSHVIIPRTGQEEVPAEVIREGASLAAWYSQARCSGQVPVDYTLKKHVRKPRGAKPGMVIYEQQKTLYVTPVPEEIQKLKLATGGSK